MSWFINDGLFVRKYSDIKRKGAIFRRILWDISRSEGLKRLNNSVLKNKGVLWMDFGANKMPIEVIREGAFGGTYLKRHLFRR